MTTPKEAAYLYLKQFRSWPSLRNDVHGEYYVRRFADLRSEAMRRARMAGLTYTAIGKALDISSGRAAAIIRKAIARGQNAKTGFKHYRPDTRAESRNFIRMIVTPRKDESGF